MKEKTIIFVHPALWGGDLITEAKKLGYLTFAIITTFESAKINPEYLHEHCDFVFDGSSDPALDLEKIKALISQQSLEVCAIINGIDSAVCYTDYLQNKILNYSIDLNASRIRLNKYAVNQKIKEHHLPVIPSLEIKSLKDYEDNISSIEKLDFPLLIKPSENTAANADVQIVKTLDELKGNIEKLLGKQNAYYNDQAVNKIIIQKYLSNKRFTEFSFDFTSFVGEHRCIGIIEYLKTDAGILEGAYPRIADEIPNVMPIIEYVRDCLNALDVKYGFTHIEVFWNDEENEYYLIEVNNRYAGVPAAPCYSNTYQEGPLKQYLNLASGKQVELIPNKRIGYSIIVLLYNFHIDFPEKLNLEKLHSSIIFTIFRANTQKRLRKDFYKDNDLSSRAGAVIVLSASSEEQLRQDYTLLREMEDKGGLFF